MSSRDPVSAQSQGSQRREENQSGYPEQSLSMGDLIQSCATTLENECANLERENELKTLAVNELRESVLRQTENISKQQSDLEHLKVLIQREVLNRETFIAKNSAVRDKSEKLHNDFSRWFKNINLLLLSKENVGDILKQKLIQEENDQKAFSEMDKQYKRALENADSYIHQLETLRDREQSEFKEIKAHLRAQLSMHGQQEKEFEGKLRELQGNCREKETMINMLTPQNSELKKTLEKLQISTDTEVKEVESKISQLQTELRSSLERTDKFTKRINGMEKMIFETNNEIMDKEEEIKEFDSKQKQLITKEEECLKTMENEMENIKKLQSEVELMKEQMCRLLKVEEENSTLKLETEKMEEVAQSTKVKINETEKMENLYACEIEKIGKEIEEMENNKSKLITDKQIIDENIRELENEMNENKRQHELLSEEIDEPFVELTKKHESINKSLNLLSEQLNLHSEDKVKFEETIKRLKEELDRAMEISKASDSKLFSQYEEFSQIHADLIGKDSNLDDMIAKIVQDYSKAQNDILLSEEIKLEINELEADLDNEKVSFHSVVEQLQESHKRQIQAKCQEMADLRIQYEREFRNKEQSKTDALVELKENKTRITDLQKMKDLTDSEIKKTHSNVVKCDSLARKLENKLITVARVATEHSQSSATRRVAVKEAQSQPSAVRQFQSSQSTNLLESTPPTSSRGIKHSNFPSPGSESSALTYNPDEVDLMKVRRKNASQKRPQKAKKNLKENKQEKDAFADWGF